MFTDCPLLAKWICTLLSIPSWEGRGSACKAGGAERETEREEWDQRVGRNEGEVRTILRLPRLCGGEEFACQCRRDKRRGFRRILLGQKDLLEWEMATHSRILVWKIPHGQRSLMGYSPWSHKQSDKTEWLSTARNKENMGTEVFIKETEVQWWLESWVPGKNWGGKGRV